MSSQNAPPPSPLPVIPPYRSATSAIAAKPSSSAARPSLPARLPPRRHSSAPSDDGAHRALPAAAATAAHALPVDDEPFPSAAKPSFPQLDFSTRGSQSEVPPSFAASEPSCLSQFGTERLPDQTWADDAALEEELGRHEEQEDEEEKEAREVEEDKGQEGVGEEKEEEREEAREAEEEKEQEGVEDEKEEEEEGVDAGEEKEKTMQEVVGEERKEEAGEEEAEEEEEEEEYLYSADRSSEDFWHPPAWQTRHLAACTSAPCAVCLCEEPAKLLRPCGANAACAVCTQCFTQHLEHSIASSRYAAPPMRCPCCRTRLPMVVWAAHAPSFATFLSSARALLSLRCASCHEPSDLLAPAATPAARERCVRQLRAKLPPAAVSRLLDGWERFARAEGSAAELVELLATLLPAEEADDEPYDAAEATGRMTPPQPMERILSKWLAPMVVDVERRAALQLAWYRRFPFIRSQCCEEEMCFKCNTQGHHHYIRCEVLQQEELSIDVQYCPGCDVPTIRSDGCDHMLCICGTEWDWQE